MFAGKQSETAATCSNKQFWQKINLFSLPICQEEINKIIFVWIYKLENEWHLFTNRKGLQFLIKITN